MNTQRISLDIGKGRTGEHVTVAQGDTGGTTIEAEIYDNGAAVDLTGCSASFLMMQPDRAHYVRDTSPTCSGNVITYVVDEAAIAGVSGYTDECYFEIAPGGGTRVYSTQRFAMDILRDVMAGRTPGANYDSLIAEALESVEGAGAIVAAAASAAEDASAAAADAVTAAAEARSAVGALGSYYIDFDTVGDVSYVSFFDLIH